MQRSIAYFTTSLAYSSLFPNIKYIALSEYEAVFYAQKYIDLFRVGNGSYLNLYIICIVYSKDKHFFKFCNALP